MTRISDKEKWKLAIAKGVTKLTPEVIDKLKSAFSIGATIPQACFYAEIHITTYYDWIKKYPKLSQEFDRMKEKLPLAAKYNIADAIQTKKDLFHSRWLIERKEPEEYGDSIKVKHSGEINSNVSEADRLAIEEFHSKLKQNIKSRILEKAKEDGEL